MTERDERRSDPLPGTRAAKASPAPPPTADDTSPVVLIPVLAEDFDRRKRRILWTGVITAAVLIGGASYLYKRQVDPIRARESFESAERLFKIARYNQAILEFEHVIALDPALADAYLLMGRSKIGLARSQDAVPDFTKVIELRPNDTTGYLDRAAAYIDLEKYDLAVKDCTRGIAINPQLGPGYNLRGVAYRSMNQLEQALKDMNRAVELAPIMNHYFERAATLQLLGQHERALEDLTKVIEFAPLNGQAYHARARSYRALGDVESADRDHSFGLSLDHR